MSVRVLPFEHFGLQTIFAVSVASRFAVLVAMMNTGREANVPVLKVTAPWAGSLDANAMHLVGTDLSAKVIRLSHPNVLS